ncbi:MAG TPA: hypothetical protein VGH28_22955 [Polyangiaceae bacterium]|jgi:hypothetical protein
MGKKRKKSSQTPEVPSVAPVANEAPASQPAMSEEAATAIVEAQTQTESAKPPVVAVAEAKAETKPEPEPEPTPEPTPIVAEAAPESAVAESESQPPPTARPRKKVVRKKKRTTKPPAVTREALDQKIDRLEAKLEEKKEEAAKAAREGFGSNPALDDTSVPPVDLEIHDDFFAAGETPQPPTKESGAFTAVDPRHAQKMSSHAVARRAHLSRYVKWVVGASAGLLMLGFTVQRFRGHTSEDPVRHEVTHAAAAQPAPEQKAEPVVAEQKPAPVAENVDTAKPEDKPAATDVAATAEAKDAAVVETDQPKGDLPPEKPKNAWQEKQAAKAALERGSNGAAIAAGERAVALDGSDAESWLVLGAAYQAMGNVGQAKRCFHSCISQGKKGPVSDCRDMLSSL